MRRKLEATLLDPVASYLKRRGFKTQFPELPFFAHRIDLFGLSERLDQTVAVELKIRDWRRAFEQALVYQLCSDITYVAFPLTLTRRISTEIFRPAGIGVISITDDGRCKQVMAPAPSTVLRSHYRDACIRAMMELSL